MAVTTLLVANRGEIACRIIRTARAMGIRTVAVYSDPDRTALHVAMADEAVPLRGVAPADTYLRTDLLVEAAALAGADSVHPGYGFLAENPVFARACIDGGLTFVGPSPEAIAAMGDKLQARAAMADAGVPLLPASAVEASGSPAQGADEVGFPLLVKATAGGGGKGMRLVADPAELDAAVQAARREAGAAFGDDRVFLERFVTSPRHIEVQILGDSHGTVVALGERECSVQRRHQKVVEESPSPAVDDALRTRLYDAALTAARAIGYTNAGTVEFVLGADGEFSFLEVNTRLQVEHPVTEEAWRLRDGTRLDLVRLQLLVAQGHPLPFAQDDVVADGWAVEARMYAEDPAAGFLPATGRLQRWILDSPGVRVDTGVRAGDDIGTAYDPLLAKVIAAAPTRREASLRLAAALEGARIAGVTTNRDLLVATLRSPVFLDGDYDTGFIDDHLDGGRVEPPRRRHTDELHAIAAAVCAARRRHLDAAVVPSLPMAWRNNPSQPVRTGYRTDTGTELLVGYLPRRDGRFQVSVAGVEWVLRVLAWPDEHPEGLLDAEIDGRRMRADVAAAADGAIYVSSAAGHSRLTEIPRLPEPGAAETAGGLGAPMPGTVVSVAVAVGEAVTAGQLLVVLEAMKMEHRVTAPHDGEVTDVRVEPGGRVDAGDVLVVLE